jgi:hypothetical protein
VLYPVDSVAGVGGLQIQDVKAQCATRQAGVGCQKVAAGANQAALLVVVYAGRPTAIASVTAQTHLGNDHNLGIEGDQVEFTATTTVVAQQNLKFLRFEKGCGRLLSGAPNGQRVYAAASRLEH